MRAKKSLGQHFLKSERALAAIVEAGRLNSGDTVLEIGPGTGALTEKLLETGAKVVAVEKDDNLYENLKIKFQNEINSGKLILIHDDILNFEIENFKLKIALPDGRQENYKVVANIPYNITGAILKKFLSAECQPKRMVLLVQKEVAERIVGGRGRQAFTKESILSISVKVYGRPRYVETVKAGSFAPAPKVDSAIITVEDISRNFFNRGSRASTISEEFFFKLLKAGFQSKRKKLSSNLSKHFDKKKVNEAFGKLNLDPNLRAEDLPAEKWGALARLLVS